MSLDLCDSTEHVPLDVLPLRRPCACATPHAYDLAALAKSNVALHSQSAVVGMS
jgi:hypothetical protein